MKCKEGVNDCTVCALGITHEWMHKAAKILAINTAKSTTISDVVISMIDYIKKDNPDKIGEKMFLLSGIFLGMQSPDTEIVEVGNENIDIARIEEELKSRGITGSGLIVMFTSPEQKNEYDMLFNAEIKRKFGDAVKYQINERGEKCVHIVDSKKSDEIMAYMEALNISLTEQLNIKTKKYGN